MLTIYDSLSAKKKVFKPREPGKVSLYVCGMTVYDYCHIGHARAMIFFDGLVKYFKLLGYDVTYIRNITDIDDKIIARANDNHEATDDLTKRFVAAMHEDELALGNNLPTHEPSATEYVDQMISFIQKLIEKEAAYVASNGDVCFSVRSCADYAKLSKRNIEDLRSGARVDVGHEKHDPLDFVLWKNAKPGEPSWSSPWGDGRPGWHIECSVMSHAHLGAHFDIHGGGLDLKFPHHDNEIAQSEAYTDQPLAENWMHIGLVQVNGEKMSKSLGNFYTIREVLESYHPEVIRYFMISGHYRSPINYSAETLSQLSTALSRLYLAMRGVESSEDMTDINADYVAKFTEAMNDDFNTPKAISVLFDLSHALQKIKQSDVILAQQYVNTLRYLAGIFGLLQCEPDVFLRGDVSEAIAKKVQGWIDERNQARAKKDFVTADRLRDQLSAEGIHIEDTPEGTLWRKM